MKFLLAVVLLFGINLALVQLFAWAAGGRPYRVILQATTLITIVGFVGFFVPAIYAPIISFMFVIMAMDMIGFGVWSAVLAALLYGALQIAIILALHGLLGF